MQPFVPNFAYNCSDARTRPTQAPTPPHFSSTDDGHGLKIISHCPDLHPIANPFPTITRDTKLTDPLLALPSGPSPPSTPMWYVFGRESNRQSSVHDEPKTFCQRMSEYWRPVNTLLFSHRTAISMPTHLSYFRTLIHSSVLRRYVAYAYMSTGIIAGKYIQSMQCNSGSRGAVYSLCLQSVHFYSWPLFAFVGRSHAQHAVHLCTKLRFFLKYFMHS